MLVNQTSRTDAYNRNIHHVYTISFAGKHPPHRCQPLPLSQHSQPPSLTTVACRRRTGGCHRCSLPGEARAHRVAGSIAAPLEELLPRQIYCCQALHSSEEEEDEGCYAEGRPPLYRRSPYYWCCSSSRKEEGQPDLQLFRRIQFC
nr:hypothetical protein Iba_chr02cCG9980 [Ipomoea batatas]